MPYPLQVRLLRVLQERLINPLGSSKSIPVDIAIICATHRDLRDMIVQNRFREDLYYRLNGLVVKLPPLRERTDLSAVIQKMLQSASSESADGQRLSVADEVMTLFEQCAWPGNFRQLGNLLRTAAAMVDADGSSGASICPTISSTTSAVLPPRLRASRKPYRYQAGGWRTSPPTRSPRRLRSMAATCRLPPAHWASRAIRSTANCRRTVWTTPTTPSDRLRHRCSNLQQRCTRTEQRAVSGAGLVSQFPSAKRESMSNDAFVRDAKRQSCVGRTDQQHVTRPA